MANILANANGDWNVGATWIGGVVPGPGDNAYLNNKTIAIDGNIECALISNRAENGAVAGGILTLDVDGVNITADMQPGVTMLTVTADVDLDVTGVIYGGTTNAGRSIVWDSPGTLTITGNPVPGTGGTTAQALLISHASAVVNIIGDLVGSTTTAVPPVSHASAGTLNVTGNCVGGSFASAEGLEITSVGALANVTGDVTGGSSTATYGILVSSASATVVVTGNISGGSGTTGHGLYSQSTSNITIHGDVTGGTASNIAGVYNQNVGSITINGTATASEAGGNGVHNQNAGTINLKRAKANSWGPGSSAAAVGYGVYNANVGGVVIVEEVEYGVNGQTPTFGIIFFKNVSTNKCITQTAGGTKTLSDPNDTAGLVPAESDVRSGVVYAGGVNTGTCAVPAAASVAAGVPVDATVGEAVITIPTLISVVGQVVASTVSD